MPNYQPPLFNLLCTIWLSLDGHTTNGPPLYTNQKCNARAPRSREIPVIWWQMQVQPVTLVVGLPLGLTVPDDWGRHIGGGTPSGALIELPEGSGQLYYVVVSEVAARGFPNAHLNCYCQRIVINPPEE